MKPHRDERTNSVYEHGDPEIDDLPVFADMQECPGRIICKSYWKPTPDEIAALMCGEPVCVACLDGQPAIRVEVEGVSDG